MVKMPEQLNPLVQEFGKEDKYMGRPIKVTIDSDTLKEMFFDRCSDASQWMKHYDDEEAFCEYYGERRI